MISCWRFRSDDIDAEVREYLPALGKSRRDDADGMSASVTAEDLEKAPETGYTANSGRDRQKELGGLLRRTERP